MLAPIVTCGNGRLGLLSRAMSRVPKPRKMANVAATFTEAEARPFMPRPIEKYGMNFMEMVRPSVPKSHSYFANSSMPGVLAANA